MFHLASPWVLALVLLLVLLVKHFVIERLLQTDYAVTHSQSQGWVGALLTNCAINAIVDVIVLFFFTSLFWVVILALADAAFLYGLGYWKKRRRVPELTKKDLIGVYHGIAVMHSTWYAAVAGVVLKHLFPNSLAIKLVSAVL